MPYTILNMRDITDYVAPDQEDNGSAQSGGISFSASLSDPASTWDFVVDDVDQSINVQNFQPVIIFDDDPPDFQSVPTIPSMNFVVAANYTIGGTLSSIVTLTQGNPVNPRMSMTFANNASGQGYISQTTLLGYVQPGVKYMFSAYLNITVALVNANAFLQINWLDINESVLSTISASYVSLSSTTRENISGVAPTGAVYAQIICGGQTTVAGSNSGTMQWAATQFEPMWFESKGISYPTPECNFSQVNSIKMPDGTTSRKCRLFAGYVEDHVNSYVGTQRHTAVQCASSSKLLETAGYISASYTNTVDTSILSDALSLLPSNAAIIGQLATGQQNFFSPLSTLIAGVTVDSISFNNATLREVCNSLSAQSGSMYYVDPYYYLWYVPPSFVGTAVYLSDDPDNVTSFPYHDFSIEYDSTNPVNVALVQGSKQNATAITDTFSGDGSTTVFDLSFPPHTVTSVTKNGGSAVRTGVAGVDQINSTIRALINKQAQTIEFAVAPVSGTNNTQVTYTYEDQVISKVVAADAVAQQRLQCWGLISDSNITSTTSAKNRGLKELTDYAFPRVVLTLSALNIYLPVGSLILFTNQSEGFTNQPFVVQTVESDMQGGGVYRWNYTAGVYNPTLIDHFRNVSKAVKKTPTTANVAVVASTDVAIFDTFVINDSVTVNNGGAPDQGPYQYGSATYGFASYA